MELAKALWNRKEEGETAFAVSPDKKQYQLLL
jgi:hypothetical protein